MAIGLDIGQCFNFYYIIYHLLNYWLLPDRGYLTPTSFGCVFIRRAPVWRTLFHINKPPDTLAVQIIKCNDIFRSLD